MKKYVIHIGVWIIGIVIYMILKEINNNSMHGFAILWGMCASFFIIYYWSMLVSRKKKKHEVSTMGVASGRAFGIFVNMFVLQYITELYKSPEKSIFLAICSIIILFIFRKEVIKFYIENGWGFSFMIIYVATNILFTGIYSLIGFYYEEVLMVIVEYIPFQVKVLLIFIYILVSLISVVPNSFIMKVATINEDL